MSTTLFGILVTLPYFSLWEFTPIGQIHASWKIYGNNLTGFVMKYPYALSQKKTETMLIQQFLWSWKCILGYMNSDSTAHCLFWSRIENWFVSRTIPIPEFWFCSKNICLKIYQHLWNIYKKYILVFTAFSVLAKKNTYPKLLIKFQIYLSIPFLNSLQSLVYSHCIYIGWWLHLKLLIYEIGNPKTINLFLICIPSIK